MHDHLGECDVEAAVGKGKLLGNAGLHVDLRKRARIAATNEADGSIAETASVPKRSTSCAVNAPGPQPTSSAR
jgi:hypothetical protein